MNYKMRLGGITLLTSLIASVAFASGAQAGSFFATAYPATVSGSRTSEQYEFTTARWTVKCAKSSVAGILKEAASTLTVSPEYAECGATVTYIGTTYVTVATTVKTNGCTFTYHDEVTDSKTVSTGKTTINCPAGKVIEYSFYEALVGESHAEKPLWCTLGVGPQGALPEITYTNNPEAKVTDVQVNSSLSVSITKITGALGVCGPIVPGATYSSTTTLSAKNSKGESISLSAS